MKDLKIIACPDCRARFKSMADLNKHISRTGCNEGRHLSLVFDFSRRNPALVYKDCIRTF
ncbi:MAG: hypothetical protein QXJ74_05225 [Nitrososphaera sp.]